ncbi:hypothetical protein Tco_0936101 [Tanacetum coccineum]
MKQQFLNLETSGDHRKVQLNELNELRDHAYENSLIYKEKTKRIHDSKIKNRVFNVGDQVLLFNSRLKMFSGKLKSRWSGPFTITQVFPYGTVELSQNSGPNFKGLRGYRKLNKGALDLYVGNGNTAAVEAIGSFDLILPSGMILVLDNCNGYPRKRQKSKPKRQNRAREQKER